MNDFAARRGALWLRFTDDYKLTEGESRHSEHAAAALMAADSKHVGFSKVTPSTRFAIRKLENKINVIYRPPINKLIPNEVDV